MPDRFFTRFLVPFLPKRDGAAAYTMIIRGADDPERETREEMKARGAGAGLAVLELNKIMKSETPELWADRLVEYLQQDGKPRTFNRLGVELVGKTADALMASNLQRGLVLAVADGRLACTIAAPILFRTRAEGDVDVAAAEAEDEPMDLASADPSSPTGVLTGHEAIDYAEKHGGTLAKHTDPTEEARSGLSVEEARAIAKEDPGLIVLEEEPPAIAVDLDLLEDAMLELGDAREGVRLDWCDDGEMEALTVHPRRVTACATVWADGLVQLHADGDIDSEPTDHRFTSAAALWKLITKGA